MTPDVPNLGLRRESLEIKLTISADISPVEPTSDAWQSAETSLSSAGYTRYGISLLLGIYVVNNLDRQVVNILAEPIKRDLGLADWQLGLMSGLAFAVLYTVLGIPIARLAERGDRPYIIAVAAAVWGGFTVASSMAGNFGQLILARIGVGVGEAGCTPPSHSLIMDYAPPEKRSSMLAFYGMGAPIGGLLGMAFGGIVADKFGWRVAFLLAGLPGLILAALAATTLKEPRRMLAKRAADIAAGATSFRGTLRLLATKRSLWFLAMGITIKAFVMYGNAPFIASFFLRSHTTEIAALAQSVRQLAGLQLQPVGLMGIILGLLSGIGGALGFWLGGVVADMIGKGNLTYYMHFSAIAAALTVLPGWGLLTVSSMGPALVLLAIQGFLGGLHYGPTYAIAYSIVPPHSRATTSALLLFVVNLLALGLGPLAVGLLSDAFGAQFGPAEGLRFSLLTFSLMPLVAAILFMIGSRTVQADAAVRLCQRKCA